MSHPEQIGPVAVPCKANVYFDGRVISHTLLHTDGSRQTLGLVYPGEYRFDTAAAERMDIVAGRCRVRVAGAADWRAFEGGSGFDVPADSHFEIAVEQGICEYLCSFR